MVYSRTIQGDTYTFGISGLLYKSNVIFYDHQTESLWSQLMGKAIAGRLASTPLEEIPSGRMSWESWRERYPDTQVLSTETGYQRDYSVDPYEGYYRLGSIWFPVGDVRRDLSPKERVLGIEMDGRTKAYPLSALKDKPGVFTDTIGGKAVKIEINSEGEIVDVRTETEKPVSHLFSYWFAWQAFHPETQVYESGK